MYLDDKCDVNYAFWLLQLPTFICIYAIYLLSFSNICRVSTDWSDNSQISETEDIDTVLFK